VGDPSGSLTVVEMVDNAIKAGLLTVLAGGARALLLRADRAGPHLLDLANRFLADRAEERAERKAERLARAQDRDAATSSAGSVERFTAALADTAARLEAALAQARADAPTSDIPIVRRSTSVPPATPQIFAPNERAVRAAERGRR
jgi:hypothetical protein